MFTENKISILSVYMLQIYLFIFMKELFVTARYFAEHTARIAGDDYIIRNILCNNAPGTDNGILSYIKFTELWRPMKAEIRI